ncbi:MAG: sigma-70 family RNA polymerase sigma factor [Aureliella sp.]
MSDCDRLLERHRSYLMLLARARILPVNGRKLDSSDIVQQTLMDAFAKREQFRGSNDAELAGWLREILKHNLLDGLRNAQRDKRDVRREQALGATIDESISRADAWLAAVQSSPSQRASKQEELLRLSEALEALPIAQREAIVLHHLQGLKLAEVAVELGRSESAIAGLLFRGLNKLHQLLSK